MTWVLKRTQFEFEREAAEGEGLTAKWFNPLQTSTVDPFNAAEQDNLSLAK